jgi:hypothetical protein
MGWDFEGSPAAATKEHRPEGAHRRVLAESASAPLPKRQRVVGSTDRNTDRAALLPSFSESMTGVEFAENLAPSSHSNAPSEDEILIQVSGAFEYRLSVYS